MKRTYKFILSIFIIMIIFFNFINIFSLANQEVNVYYKDDCGNLLKKDGKIVKITYVVFNNNGKESPVFCLDKNKPGVGEVGDYIVNVNNVIKDVRVWRAIKNGYPYKTPKQLNCENYKEAFAATKMAVYSVLYNYTEDTFEPIGEEGQRTLNALKNILEKVNNSTEKPFSSNIIVREDEEKWQQDETDKNYVYKLMSVKAESSIKKYNIYLGKNYPEGIKITDKNNNYRESFSENEQFKISISIKELKSEGTINLKVIGQLKSSPIYIGESSDPNNQNYAITQIETENGEGEKNINYSDNKTTIKIIKYDEENNTLKNATFEILNEDKKIIETNLNTNDNGEIYVKNLIPGKYYIREIKAPEGYENYNQLIEINVKFNEELSVIVKNSKEKEPTIEIDRNFMEVSSIKQELKLPKTGM